MRSTPLQPAITPPTITPALDDFELAPAAGWFAWLTSLPPPCWGITGDNDVVAVSEDWPAFGSGIDAGLTRGLELSVLFEGGGKVRGGWISGDGVCLGRGCVELDSVDG